jgi:hypothetical protein
VPRAIPGPSTYPGAPPRAIPGPGNPGDPQFPIFTAPPQYLTEEGRLRASVADWERQVSAFKGRIQELQDRINGAKNGGMAWLVPQLQVELDLNTKKLGEAQNALSKDQNKYWEVTGQYEKLLSGADRDAFAAVNAMFKNFGLESLSGKIFDYVKNGYSPDTISILLQDTAEYKQRFVGNEARKKAGLPVLSAAEYLATEAAYRQVMESAGLPKGFYDQNTDFADFIGKNVSPSEIQDRVNLAVQATTLAPPEYREALKDMGISEGDMVAYWLDDKKAMPMLTKAAATAKLGAAAKAQGLAFDIGYAESLAQRGITADQASQGYSAIAAELENLSTLGSIYGERWNQRTSEEAMFQGNAQALATKRKLASQERGQFSGSAGAGRGGLAQRGGQR